MSKKIVYLLVGDNSGFWRQCSYKCRNNIYKITSACHIYLFQIWFQENKTPKKFPKIMSGLFLSGYSKMVICYSQLCFNWAHCTVLLNLFACV